MCTTKQTTSSCFLKDKSQIVISGEMPDNESLPKSDERASSWAQRIGDSVAQMSKNILEVILEKDIKGAFSVSDVDCARLLTKLGLDLRPGLQVEGVQLCPNGRGVILITLKDSINIE